LDTIIAATMRADAGVTDALIAGAHPDRYSIHFLRRSRQLLLAVSVALSAAVDAHRRVPGPHGSDVCGSCGTTDICRTVRRVADTLAVYLPGPVLLSRAEAWRRADAGLNASGQDRLVGVADIADGYVAWTASAPYPVRDRPALDDESVVIIDKRSGRITKWPALPLDMLNQEYRRYLEGPGLA
jgi:hypothetical protein